jgi:hypothetical protein
MKIYLLGFFLSAIFPSIADASYCREKSRSNAEMVQCEETSKRNGVDIFGDWSVSTGVYFYDNIAVNKPLFISSSRPDVKKKMELMFFCLGSWPALNIFTGGLLENNSIVSYKFDEADYIDIGSVAPYKYEVSTTEYGNGYISMSNVDFINKIFSMPHFSLRLKMSDGVVVEHLYKLEGGVEARKKFSCLENKST